ncbi:MAG: hypothetical protein WCA15_09405 [Candidatus Acidiferrales bacterium]
MTEFLRKQAGPGSELSRVADPNSMERATDEQITEERVVNVPVENDSDGRTWAPAAPAEPRPASVATAPSAANVGGAATAAARAPQEERVALFAPSESSELRARWDSIQVGFVDEPRKAVQEADALVSETMKRLADIFGDERQKLEQQWDRSEDISTEDFRLALRRYRSFFGRLLAI